MNITAPPVTLMPQNDGVEFCWHDGTNHFFHYVWLRDCCYCEQCGDSYSSNRFLHPHQVSLTSKPQTMSIEADDVLTIIWQEDAHESTYRLDWLKQNAYSAEALQERRHLPTLWGNEISQSPPSADYREAKKHDEIRLHALRQLRDYGFVVIRESPANESGIDHVADLFGEIAESAYGKYFELTPSSQLRTAGTSLSPVPPIQMKHFAPAHPESTFCTAFARRKRAAKRCW